MANLKNLVCLVVFLCWIKCFVLLSLCFKMQIWIDIFQAFKNRGGTIPPEKKKNRGRIRRPPPPPPRDRRLWIKVCISTKVHATWSCAATCMSAWYFVPSHLIIMIRPNLRIGRVFLYPYSYLSYRLFGWSPVPWSPFCRTFRLVISGFRLRTSFSIRRVGFLEKLILEAFGSKSWKPDHLIYFENAESDKPVFKRNFESWPSNLHNQNGR